jgi:hypothetical protein
MPPLLFFWKGAILGGAGVALASSKTRKLVLRHQLKRMARGELELSELGDREEGELVVVRGIIDCDRPLSGVLVESDGVFRRMIFKSRGTWVHEAAINFSLIDESGERILIQAGGARWLVPNRETFTYPGTRFAQSSMPGRVREITAGKSDVEAFEQVLGVGERVQIVGYKTTSPDVTGGEQGYRLPPQRATLRSGPDLPLILVRLSDVDG